MVTAIGVIFVGIMAGAEYAPLVLNTNKDAAIVETCIKDVERS